MVFLDRLKTRCRRKKAERHTVHELSSLSNKALADLGINRSDIPFLAKKSAKLRFPMPR